MSKVLEQVRAELANENIRLNDLNISRQGMGKSASGSNDDRNNGRPRAEITPQGDLLIDGRKISANADQQALLKDYRKQIEDIAVAGMDIGIAGADLGMKAANNAVSALFSGKTDQIEARIEREAKQIKAAATKLCDQLPAMLNTQTQLAAKLPAFRPYATMDQSDIDKCYKDEQLDDATRATVRNEVREGVRTSIRNAIRNGIQRTVQVATGGARTVPELGDDTNADAAATDVAAEAEAASVEDAAKN